MKGAGDCRATAGRRRLLLPGVIVAACAGLLLANLGGGLFFPDETETALQAASVLRHGVPIVDQDGSRVLPIVFGWVNDDGVWIHTPWLDEYLAAGSIAVFGQNRFAARLPFALVALASVALFWPLAKRVLPQGGAMLALVLFAFSAALIGHGRMCRYYSMAILAQVLFLWAINDVTSRRQGRGTLLASLAHALFFYTNYIPAFLNAAAFAAFALHGRRRFPGIVRSLLLYAAVAAAISLPWLWYIDFRLFGELGGMSSYLGGKVISSGPSFDPSRIAHAFRNYLFAFDLSMYPLVVGAAIFLWRRLRGPASVGDGLNPVILYSIVLTVVSLFGVSFLPIFAFRYILFLLPSAKLLLAATLLLVPRLARNILVGLLLACQLLVHPLKLLFPLAPEDVAHLGVCASLMMSFVEKREIYVQEWLAEVSSPGDLVQTVGEEMDLQFFLPGRRWRCVEFADALPGDPPDFVLTESFMGYRPQDHFVPLPKSWREHFREIVVSVPAAKLGIRTPDQPLRPSLVYRRQSETLPADVESTSQNLIDRVRGCWVAGTSTRLAPIAGKWDWIRISPGDATRERHVDYRAIKRSAWLGGGIPVELGQTMDVSVASEDSLTSLRVSLLSADDASPCASPQEATFRNGRWQAELSVVRSVPEAIVRFEFEADEDVRFGDPRADLLEGLSGRAR